MQHFGKKDLFFSVVTGLIAGTILWRVFVFLKAAPIFGIPYLWLIAIIPILWVVGVNLGFFLGRWIGFFNQFGKYAAIGFTNFSVDLGVLNLLISYSGIENGVWYSVFKTISFIVAVTHSFFWNKFWAFESGNEKMGGEFGKFVLVSLVGTAVNVAVASVLVSVIGPKLGFSAVSWASVGSVVGSAMALIFNFFGYRMTVFNRKTENVPNPIQKI